MRELQVSNPKRNGNASRGRENWYEFYAGYSSTFAYELLHSLELPVDAVVMDPWNGVGTTTTAAAVLGLRAYGFDLNPAMVVIAKGMLISKRCCHDVVNAVEHFARVGARPLEVSEDDPLLIWFTPAAVGEIRRVEMALLGASASRGFRVVNVDRLSRKQAFTYLFILRMVKQLLAPLHASNPTWLKRPRDFRRRLRPSPDAILEVLLQQVQSIVDYGSSFAGIHLAYAPEVSIQRASSLGIPLPDESVDVVLTSPPYCTRIDYAVSTSGELAVLGYGEQSGYRELRESLLGTSTVPAETGARNLAWGKTCNEFLDQVRTHPSKASSGYYYKSHMAYFEGVFSSIEEVSRVLRRGGLAVIVVQDSYYKDVHNDLPVVVREMANSVGLRLSFSESFASRNHMANRNPLSRQYGPRDPATEFVMGFSRSGL